MADSFNLRQFLSENKLTKNARLLNETYTYFLDFENVEDEEVLEMFIEEQAEYVVPRDLMEELDAKDTERIVKILKEKGEHIYDSAITGLDPYSDGIEEYYKVNNLEDFKDIAKILAQYDNLLEIAQGIAQKEYEGFIYFNPIEGTGTVLPVVKGGLSKIKKLLNNIKK